MASARTASASLYVFSALVSLPAPVCLHDDDAQKGPWVDLGKCFRWWSWLLPPWWALIAGRVAAGTFIDLYGLILSGGGVAGAGGLDRMAASADRVWDLASDITRVGEISPETFEAEWPGGASGPEVGARFRGHVRRNGRGPVYWTVCTVVACDPGREFAFAVAGPGGMTMNTLALPAGTQRGVPMSPSRLSWPTRRSCACTGWSPGLRAAAPPWTACGSPGKDQGSHRIRRSFPVGPTPKLPVADVQPVCRMPSTDAHLAACADGPHTRRRCMIMRAGRLIVGPKLGGATADEANFPR